MDEITEEEVEQTIIGLLNIEYAPWIALRKEDSEAINKGVQTINRLYALLKKQKAAG